MDPRILVIAAVIGGGVLVGNEVRHDFTALRHHGCCRVVTAHAVACPRHGQVYLTEKAWLKYAGNKSPFSHPSCPICGRPAEEK